MGSDIRFALRQLKRSPAFAVAAIATLALGVGVNSAIYGLLNAYLRPLPVPNPDRIVVIAAENSRDASGLQYTFSFPALEEYRTQTSVFSDVFAFQTRISGLTVRGRTTQFVYHAVSGDFFAGLQLRPLIGRVFSPGEGETADAPAAIVLGYGYWQKRFGGDPAVVGSTVRLAGESAEIVGVAPQGFQGLHHGAEIEGYATLGTLYRTDPNGERFFSDRNIRRLTMMARLRGPMQVESAQAAVDVLGERLRAEYPEERDFRARVVPETMARPAPLRGLGSLVPVIRTSMLGLAALVLLVACLNVTNLFLTRSTARQREIALRLALGAGRVRTVRFVLVETLVVAAAATVAGLVLGHWSMNVFVRSINLATDVPLDLRFGYDWRVFVHASAMAVSAALLVGTIPAIRFSRTRLTTTLNEGAYGGTGGGAWQRLCDALVIAQTAGCLVPLVVAGLFVRNLQRTDAGGLGFTVDQVLTVRLDPNQLGYDAASTERFYSDLQRRLERETGVQSVAVSFSVPTNFIFMSCAYSPEKNLGEEYAHAWVGCNSVSPEYFDTMRIPILRGRAFTDQDTDASPRVIIVNETLARQLWPGEDPIGKQLILPRTVGSLWQVVGVARNGKYLATFETPLPYAYFPMAQNPTSMRVIHVRSDLAADRLRRIVREAVTGLDPDMPLADLKTVQETVEGSVGLMMLRIGVIQGGTLAAVGVLLAMVGVYGLMSYGVSQRTREIGIRLALGAEPRSLRNLLLLRGGRLVAAGIVLGVFASVAVTRMASRIFLVSPFDVLTFAAASLLLAAAGLLACYLPARRAQYIGPIVALRQD